MRWQRWARGVVALVGLTCAVAVYIQFGHRKPPEGGPPAMPIDPTTTSQSSAGTMTRQKDGRDTLHITYEGRTTYSDGRVSFERAHMKAFDERGLEIWADVVDTSGRGAQSDNPTLLTLRGHVRLTTKDGLEALMDRANYNDADGILTTPGRMTFTKGRMSGEGERATYDEKADCLQLLDRSHVTLAPDAQGNGSVDATSTDMTLNRPAHILQLIQNARIVRDGDTLTAQNSTLHFTADESKLKTLELRTNSRVVPGQGREGTAPPDMRADDIDLVFHEDGSTIQYAQLVARTGVAVADLASEAGHRVISGTNIEFNLAHDGQTLTRLDARQQVVVELPAQSADKGTRTIRADSLHADGVEPTGLTSARFEGHQVEYAEAVPARGTTPASRRTVNANVLQLILHGQLDAIDSAQFDGNVTLQDADGHASAESARYDPNKGFMHLLPSADTSKPSPRALAANNEGRTVQARQINLHLDSSDLDAQGSVVTRAQPSKPSSGKAESPLFTSDVPVTGMSESLVYVGSLATYTGTAGVPARLSQDLRIVKGQRIEFNSDTRDLRATTDVEADMIADRAGSDGKTSSSRYQVRKADSLVYSDAKRLAEFKGVKAARLTVTSDDGTTIAQTFQVTFAQDSGDVKNTVWEGDVDARLTDRRHGFGQRLVYDADASTYLLTGKPAQALMPKGEGSMQCTLQESDSLRLNRTSNAGEGGLSSTPDIPCDTQLPTKVKKAELMSTLRTEGLTKAYGGRTVVQNINLKVSSGEIVGLLGPNGAGKTTTFSMVVGLTGADSGQVLLDDEQVTADPMYVRARKGIGYLPQEPSVFRGLSVEKNVLAILETQPLSAEQRRQRLASLLDELNLTPLARAKAHTLSGGERRRVEITRALVNQPKFMLLDEPFAGIDPIAVGDIQKIIFHLRDRGIGVLITDHNVRETLKITDRAYIVHGGSIFRSGTPASLAADDEVKRIYLGADFRLD